MKKPVPKKPIDASVQRRLDRLEFLIDNEYDRSAKVFQDRTGVRMAQVSEWFSGGRALRENALRRLEDKTNKPEGWFDQPLAAAKPAPAPGPSIARSPAPDSQLAQHYAALTRYAHGAVPGATAVEAAVAILARALMETDELGRKSVQPYLEALLQNPERAAELGPRIQQLLTNIGVHLGGELPARKSAAR